VPGKDPCPSHDDPRRVVDRGGSLAERDGDQLDRVVVLDDVAGREDWI
jgi:hypothetical protein